ncbi:MAG: SDR family NAD(P)-dependent oxidoreductase [Opitutales bacterium]
MEPHTKPPSWRAAPIVIAGVGAGLGAALARRFARGGCRVVMLARSLENLERIRSAEPVEIAEKLTLHACDLGNGDAIGATFTRIREALGPVGGLIYNASEAGFRSLADTTPELFERAWRTTTLGALRCLQACVEDLAKFPGAPVLLTGATSAVRGRKGAVAFSSAKFALRGFAQASAQELGHRGIHLAHLIVDGVIDESGLPPSDIGPEEDPLMRPDDIAESYWMVAHQPPSAWSLELDLRPRSEGIFE